MSKRAPVYLFTGPEKGEKDKAVSRILQDYKTESGSEPDIYRYYPFETSIREIIALLKNGDLFSDHKFVFIQNADEINNNELPDLISYINNPGENATLFLITDAYKVNKKISDAVGKENTKIFWELFENQKVNWIKDFFKRENLTISIEAIDMILDLVENRTDDLKAVCVRLAFFFKDREHITEEIVEEYVFHSKEESVFTLFAKMIKDDFNGSIEILHKLALSGNNNPVQLLSGLHWQYNNLLKLKLLISGGENTQKALNSLKIRGKRNQAAYLSALERFTAEELERIIILISISDREAREINRERWILAMELFIHNAVNKKAGLVTGFTDSVNSVSF